MAAYLDESGVWMSDKTGKPLTPVQVRFREKGIANREAGRQSFTPERGREVALKAAATRREKEAARQAAGKAWAELVKTNLMDIPDADVIGEYAEKVVVKMLGKLITDEIEVSRPGDAIKVAQVAFDISRIYRDQPTHITATAGGDALAEQFKDLRRRAEEVRGLRVVGDGT